MRRREFVALLGGPVAAWPVATFAQAPSERPLIVYFASATEWSASGFVGALKEGLGELGYVDGWNIDIGGRFANNQTDRLPAFAEEVVGLKPAIIVAGAVDTAVAAKKATSTIPIVSGALADAVHLGLVASYARPGGNVTGITPYIDGLPAKQMEFAREIVPGARKVGLLGNLNDPKAVPQRRELEEAGRTLEVEVIAPEVRSPEDLDDAIQKLVSDRAEVVIVLQTTMMLGQRKTIAGLMAAKRLPAVYGYREHVDEGGLISYGVDLRWCYRHLATYVDKILKGAAPGDLPLEFPARVQMVVNLTTAKALGITIPPLLLVRADEVIE
jgi:putative tryptophan/tyrosine transport system substrate-binding protein